MTGSVGSNRYRGCLVNDFKQLFSVFKQHFTHFNALFHPHIFSQVFLNNNFQFLNIYIKQTHNLLNLTVTQERVSYDTTWNPLGLKL